MSTACKLNPMVRERRAARAALIRELEQVYYRESSISRTGAGALAAHATLDLLTKVARSSGRSADAKGKIFARVARELASPGRVITEIP
jgi:hypothetical protein